MKRTPRKRKQRILTTVMAELPSSLELTKLKSDNSLTVKIRRGEELLGTLIMGRGSVEWIPRGHSVHIARKSWSAFAEMLDKAM